MECFLLLFKKKKGNERDLVIFEIGQIIEKYYRILGGEHKIVHGISVIFPFDYFLSHISSIKSIQSIQLIQSTVAIEPLVETTKYVTAVGDYLITY
jgi:hypothetical protein